MAAPQQPAQKTKLCSKCRRPGSTPRVRQLMDKPSHKINQINGPPPLSWWEGRHSGRPFALPSAGRYFPGWPKAAQSPSTVQHCQYGQYSPSVRSISSDNDNLIQTRDAVLCTPEATGRQLKDKTSKTHTGTWPFQCKQVHGVGLPASVASRMQQCRWPGNSE